MKKKSSLAIFGGSPLFKKVKPISNLVSPNKRHFFSYLKKSYNTSFKANLLVDELEERLCKLHGCNYCITFCNGLWAMVFAIKIMALPKKEIIMPSFTYRRLADIAAWNKLIPHFCDINPKTLVSTSEDIYKCINKNTSMILITQGMSTVIDYNDIKSLSLQFNIPLLVDSVEAGYGTFNNQLIGSCNEVECFSMHASKLLNAFEAGYITTSNREIALKLKQLRTQYQMELNEIHAALGLASIDDLPSQIQRNRNRYLTYQSCLNTPGFKLLEYSDNEKRSYKNIVVEVTKDNLYSRDDLIKIFHKENMLVRPYYSPPLHLKFHKYETIFKKLLNTENASKKYLLLPCGDFISLKDIKKICKFIDFLYS